MLVRSKNQAAKALSLSRSYMTELSKKPGFPRRDDGFFDTEAIDRFRNSVTDPARRKRSAKRSVERLSALPNICRINGFELAERIDNPAQEDLIRMLIMGAAAAAYSGAFDAMDAGCSIEQAFTISRRIGRGVIDLILCEQREFYGNIQIADGAIDFEPATEWQVDFEEIAREFGVTFDLEACLAYEQQRERFLAEMD